MKKIYYVYNIYFLFLQALPIQFYQKQKETEQHIQDIKYWNWKKNFISIGMLFIFLIKKNLSI